MSVIKDKSTKTTLFIKAASGLAITITAIGGETKLGTIGKSLEEIKEENTIRSSDW
jgi:Ca2+-transporting ATPase